MDLDLMYGYQTQRAYQSGAKEQFANRVPTLPTLFRFSSQIWRRY